MSKKDKSLLDSLMDKEITIQEEDEDEESLRVPDLCSHCETYLICSVLPTLVAISKTGIIIDVKSCPFKK